MMMMRSQKHFTRRHFTVAIYKSIAGGVGLAPPAHRDELLVVPLVIDAPFVMDLRLDAPPGIRDELVSSLDFEW